MTSYQYLLVTNGFGIAKINFACPVGTGHAQCEFAFAQEETSVFNVANTAEQIRSSFATRLMPYLSDIASLTSVNVTMNAANLISQATTTHAPVAGGESANPVSPAVALLLHKSTGLVGRENRGRMYLPYLATNLLYQPDQISAGNAAAINTSIAAWLSDMNGSSEVIVPYLIRKTDNPLQNYSVAVTTITAETVLATHRRRQRKAAHK